MEIVARYADRIDRYRVLTGRVVLIGAEKSPAYLRHAVARMHELLPGARTATIARADHSATQNRKEGGRPEEVASVLRDWLAA